jgi:predicted deacylase
MTPGPIGPLEATTFHADADGPRLLVLGGVHGNEPCGTAAIEAVAAELRAGALRVDAGCVTFVPVANPKARSQGTRRGDRDLNREFGTRGGDATFEDRVAGRLVEIMARHDVLLDLHSFRASGEAFVFVGPEDNAGPLEPFALAAPELALAQSLGVPRMVYGWLEAYTAFVAAQHEFLDRACDLPSRAPRASPQLGVGTTECFRRMGRPGVTVECGRHDDPAAVRVADRAIRGAMAHLGICGGGGDVRRPFEESYRFSRIYLREHPDDRLERQGTAFVPVARGDRLGTRHDGTPVLAPASGTVLFSYADARTGAEWIYFAERATRGTA